MKIIQLGLLLCYLLLTMNSFAAQGDKSLGGCGLGWAVNGKHSMIGITTRYTTNAPTFTFGTTTGTSGCDKHSIVFREKMKIHFANASFDELLQEMAQGKGENLVTFSRTFGCEDHVQGIFSQVVKSNYSIISQRTQNPGNLVKEVNDLIHQNPDLVNHCHNLI